MRKKFKGRHSLPVITLLTCLSLPLLAQSGDSIGIVLSTRGQVQARNAAGITRDLNRKSEIFEKDTILVGDDGMAQLRMKDDARLSFKANTEFAFNEYQFDNNPDTPDSAVMSMAKGGFRAISGTVGHQKGDTYRVDTPMASIGIRGTSHEHVIVGPHLYSATTNGGTTVSNNMGQLNLGLGGRFDYSDTATNSAPKGVLQLPQQLIQLNAALTAQPARAKQNSDSNTNGNGNNGNSNTGNGNNGNTGDANTNGGGNNNNTNNNTNTNNSAGNNQPATTNNWQAPDFLYT